MDIQKCPVCGKEYDYDKEGVGGGKIVVCSVECAKKSASNTSWERFVKDFVAEVDYDRAKNLEAGTAEVPEEAQTDLDGLVRAAKRAAKEHLGFE